MKLGSKARYGVMALVDLVLSPIQPVALSLISERQALPLPYLEQLFSKLRQAGLVESVRGVTGGYRLARDPAGITVFDIVAALEPPFKAKRCSGGEKGCQAGGVRCNTHDLWDDMDKLFHMFCKSITLEQLKTKGVCYVS